MPLETRHPDPGVIDWELIARLEGGQALNAYTLPERFDKAGVTLATGFDLGQHALDDLAALEFPGELQAVLDPYLGLKGSAAIAALDANPLHISKPQADLIDDAVKARTLDAVMDRYNNDPARPGGTRFEALPPPVQTAIVSVAFNMGVGLNRTAPKFWTYALSQDWPGLIGELKAFGAKDPAIDRRRQEEGRYVEARLAAPGAAANPASPVSSAVSSPVSSPVQNPIPRPTPRPRRPARPTPAPRPERKARWWNPFSWA